VKAVFSQFPNGAFVISGVALIESSLFELVRPLTSSFEVVQLIPDRKCLECLIYNFLVTTNNLQA